LLSEPTVTDWITALCAVAGVVAALAWRRSYLGAKTVEAEQENYVAATDVLYGLNEARNFLAENWKSLDETKAWWQTLLDPRLSEGNEHIAKLLAAQKRAALYLDRPTRGLLREISDLWVRYGMVALHIQPMALRHDLTPQQILAEWNAELAKLLAPLDKAGVSPEDHVKTLRDRVKKRFERDT